MDGIRNIGRVLNMTLLLCSTHVYAFLKCIVVTQRMLPLTSQTGEAN